MLRRLGHETCGTSKRCGWFGLGRIDGLAPCGRVDGVGHLLERHGVEVGVAEEIAAIHVGAAKGFSDVMHLRGRAIAPELWQVVATEDIQCLQQDNAAGAWRRRCQYFETVIRAGERRTFPHLVAGEVGFGDEAADLSLIGCDLPSHFPLVKIFGVLGDAQQRACEFALLEAVACGVEASVALEDAPGVGKLGEQRRMHGACFFFAENKTLARETNCRFHHLGKAEATVVFLRVCQTGDCAGNAAGLCANRGHLRDHVPLGIEIHVRACGGRRLFAVVEEVRLTVRQLARRRTDQHESAAADVAGNRMNHRQGEADSHGCVDSVAAFAEDFHAGVRCIVMDADNHRVLRMNRTHWSGRRRGLRGNLCSH